MNLAASTRPTQVVVDIADMKMVVDFEGELITHALGSCLGITVYDPVTRVAGMAHVMLPLSKVDPAKAAAKPAMFVDSAVPLLFREADAHGAQRDRLEIRVAGGAQILDTDNHFRIGQRNVTILRKLLWKNQILIAAEDVGDSISRTLTLDGQTGRAVVRSGRTSWTLDKTHNA